MGTQELISKLRTYGIMCKGPVFKKILLDAADRLEMLSSRSCKGCKHEKKSTSDYPCRACRRNWSDKYKE